MKKIQFVSLILIFIIATTSCFPQPEYAVGVSWTGSNYHEFTANESGEEVKLEDMVKLAEARLIDQSENNQSYTVEFFRQGSPMGGQFGVVYMYWYEDPQDGLYIQAIYTGVKDDGREPANIAITLNGYLINQFQLTDIPVNRNLSKVDLEIQDGCTLYPSDDANEKNMNLSYFICLPE